jgi:polar amino acid transport system ATP-binding protein
MSARRAARIELAHVTKRYGTVTAVRDVSFEIAAGSLVTLLGPSGCGKTTTLRLIAGLESVTSGRILIGDDDVTALGATDRSVSMVFQSYALFPHMSVLENVTLAPRKALGLSKREAAARADELLARFGLADKRDEYPDRLSGGQQQRVAIIRALAMRPDLLLLDEVTSALDPELVAEVLEVIRELAAAGMTMLIATHEMSFARDIADRVCFLDAGAILEQGPPDQILSAPREPRTQQFLQRIIEAGRL